MSLVHEVTLKLRGTDLLSAIWYSDGSGAKVSSGLEGTAEEWQIKEITWESYPAATSESSWSEPGTRWRW